MTEAPPSERPKTSSWWRILLLGLGLFLLSVFVFGVTGNPNLFPTVALIGNFLVPVSYVAFFYERRHMSQITLVSTARAFFYGGVLGVFAAALLEPVFVTRLTFLSSFEIGLIEEFAKILGVLVVARHHRHDSEIDGILLGGAAGMGFAALESSGYVFTAFIESGGSLSSLVVVTLLRGLLSPVGHGTWTAILASVLFREGMPNKFRINGAVIGAYLTVVVLHGLWDGLPPLIDALTGSGTDVLVGQGAVGLAGLIILWFRFREALRRAPAPQLTGSGLSPW
ncbi:MAG: PrsW family intramembrane metalloprotease [Chloroflexi bacterium]|nr:PrsW family intramembrane metalloprotease [Chloroflexota bacterium]MBV9894847.1 PrsW family intramembrane metalloprotease [Chloroflexota bacterium]